LVFAGFTWLGSAGLAAGASHSKTTLPDADAPRCGLCGKQKKLVRTECCAQWICDDEDKYVLFSYARNSCHRNHRRYTLCGWHHDNHHPGSWLDCPRCRKDIEPEMYVFYGTNEYNFEKLKNPPAFEPTRCQTCGAIIKMCEGGFSLGAKGYQCVRCTEKAFGRH
jgi:hypothetical protein